MVNFEKYIYIIVLPLVLVMSSCDKQEDISTHIKVIQGNDETSFKIEDPLPRGFVLYQDGNPTSISYSVTPMNPSYYHCVIGIPNDDGGYTYDAPESGTTYQNSLGFMSLWCVSGAGATININFIIGHQKYFGSVAYQAT